MKKLSNIHKVGHRAYDNLLIDMIEKINSFISREELLKLFADGLFKLSSFSYLVIIETTKDSIENLDMLDVFYLRAKENEENIRDEVVQKKFNNRILTESKELNLNLFNDYIQKNEENLGWGTPWTNLSFCLKFIPFSEYQKGGWINMVHLKRATIKHPHRFLILWYPMKNEETIPDTFAQDERSLYFFQKFYNLVSFSMKSKARNIYEQKVNLLKEIAPSTISHEILTNIAQPIYTFEQIQKQIENEFFKEIIATNVEMLKYTKEMADSLLVLTKRASNIQINLYALLVKIKKLTKHLLSRDSSILHINSSKELELSSDEGLLMQVLINLIMNSLEAYKEANIEENREIYLDTNLIDEYRIEIAVSDNAMIISPAIEKEIFEQGFTTKKHLGHGLGLTISSYIAKYLGGELFLRRGTQYKTTFILSIPLSYKIEQEIEEEALW